MAIQTYTIKDLQQELKSENIWKNRNIGISKDIAFTLVTNPRASCDDPALIIDRVENGDIASAVCCFKDFYYVNGEKKVMFWGNNWWTDTSKTKSPSGLFVEMEVNAATGNTHCSSGGTEDARRIQDLYVKKGFKQRAFFRNKYVFFSGKIDLSENAGLKKKIVANALSIMSIKKAFDRKKVIYSDKKYFLDYIHRVDNETDSFIRKLNKNTINRRGKEELNWIAENTFKGCNLINSPYHDFFIRKKGNIQPRSAFFVKIYNSKYELCGFCMFVLRGRDLALAYAYYTDVKLIAEVIADHFFTLNSTRLSLCGDELFNELIRNRMKRYPRVCTSLYGYADSAIFEDLKAKKEFHFGDGEEALI